MKVKVRNSVYDGFKEPIMVILTEQDKKNINKMLPSCTKYCQFPDHFNENEIKEFMQEPQST